jgi:hypothetical protein
MNELLNMTEAILDQTTDNEITVMVKRNAEGRVEISVKDSLSDICYANETTVDAALVDLKKQLREFVDDLPL